MRACKRGSIALPALQTEANGDFDQTPRVRLGRLRVTPSGFGYCGPWRTKPAEVTGILTDADLPRASWKLELSSAGYQKPGTAKLRVRERVLALPEQLALTTSQPPVSWPPSSS
jgi:hypothetical protein